MTVAPRLMGIESEYGFSSLDSKGNPCSSAAVLEKLLNQARLRFPNLCGNHRSGFFLGNGALLYVDEGMHPEFCTPECTDPRQVVCYVKAGDRMLEQLVRTVESMSLSKLEVLLFRTNVDYSGSHATWGCHESYLHRSHHTELADDLIPHLVSRVLFSGAGGFDPKSPGLEFSLSPRASYLEKTISNHSTGERGIFHIKDEPLCGHGYRRLHLICGNSLQSEIALWLTIATTTLILILSEAKIHPGETVQLLHPLGALQTLVRDPTLKTRLHLNRGGTLTALEIQRHYVRTVMAYLDKSYMPAWASEVCRRWKEILDRVERDPLSLSRTLDWSIKLAIFSETLHRHGLDWKRVRRWTDFLRRVRIPLGKIFDELDISEDVYDSPVQVTEAIPIQRHMELLTPHVHRDRLDREELQRFLVARKKLFEIDMRFGQVGERGIFRSLDRSGVLQHRIVREEEIGRAITFPPEGSRAHLRGTFIRQNWAGGRRYRCGWERVLDQVEPRFLDLSDPFETVEKWQPVTMKHPLRDRQPLTADENRMLEDLGI